MADNLVNEISIFTESSEDMGILYTGYKPFYDIIDKFLKVIDYNIDILTTKPDVNKIDMKKEIDDFKEYFKKYSTNKIQPSEIDINKIKSLCKEIKSYRNDMNKLLDIYAKLRNKIAFGGNYFRAIIKRPKVYSKSVDENKYNNINSNIRMVDYALDWVEKILIDVFNLIDQDLNILTIVNKVYAKPHIYESADSGNVIIIEHADGTYEGSIVISDECEFNESFNMSRYCEALNEYDSTKEIVYNEETNQYELQLTPEYAKCLARYCESNDPQYYIETSKRLLNEAFRIAYDVDRECEVTIVYDYSGKSKKYGPNPDNLPLTMLTTNRRHTPSYDSKKFLSNVRKYGDIDHSSENARVLAIINQKTNEKYQSARVIGPRLLTSMYFNIDGRYPDILKKHLSFNELIKFCDEHMQNAIKEQLNTIKVGEIDTTPSYKSTMIAKNDHEQYKLLNRKEMATNSKGKRIERGVLMHNAIKESYDDYIDEYDCYIEASNDTPEKSDVKLSLKNTKMSMHALYSPNKNVNQYTADIYSNLITKNLLPIWADGFRKFTIVLDTKTDDSIFEFKIPTITQDFVSRFIAGREPLNGLLRRNPDIKVRMSAAAFKTMKSPDDAYKFFMAAIKYYNEGVQRYSEKIMSNYMKLDHETKHLISTTKLSGLVTLPLQWLFQFDHVDMSDPSIFKINSGDLQKINSFVRTIYSKYASPEKEKQKVLSDLAELIKTTRNASTNDDENVKNTSKLTEAVSDWYFGKMKDTCDKHNEEWIREQTDLDWLRNPPTPEIKLLQESTKMKKLKKIPRDIIAYITIEAESIRDSGDKMLIASYCLSKLEIVEWYIELLDVGSKKYIVPHTRPYLEMMRTELLKCYDKIMKVKIIPPSERPIIDIKYPKGYEG